MRSISARRCCTSASRAARSLLELVELADCTGQFADTLQVVGQLAQGAFSGLRQGDAVVGIAGSLRQAADLGREAFGNREAGGIVLGAVDAQAGRQTLQGRCQR